VSGSAHKGTLLLTAAQLWHAVSGYIAFITGAWVLGRDDYDGFVLVVWTMTTLEIFVVDGVPRAVSWWTARLPESAAGIARRGFFLTLGVGSALAGVLALVAPLVADVWREHDLVGVIRLSALDFIAFAGFAVLVQSVNGLRRYNLQAGVWFLYSTAKVLAIVGFLRLGWGIEGAILGYIVASTIGSLAAAVLTMPHLARLRGRDCPEARRLLGFGAPMASLSLALMALVNVDLWAAKRVAADGGTAGDYAGASMLARSLFFVFKAFGDALFPAVAEALARSDPHEARRIARKGLAQLACFLIPVCGCATGAAEAVMVTLLGSDDWSGGGAYVAWLAPSSVLWTLTAVFATLVAAASRPGRVAVMLTVLFAVETVVVFVWADVWGPTGAAMGSLAAAAVGCVGTGLLMRRLLGAVIPWPAFLCAAGAACVIDRVMGLWSPDGWFVFVWGAALFAAALAALFAFGVVTAEREL
jgi:O-antigen/teichoic acid export membrane protein